MTGFRAHTFKTTAERLFTNICLGKKKEPEYKHSSGPNSMASPVVVLFLLTALFAIPPGSEYLQEFFFQTIQQCPIFVPVSSKICEGRHHECRTIARGLIIERIMKPQKYLKFKRTHTDHQVQPLAPYWTTQNQPLCLRALFKCCLNPSILVLWPLPLGTCI